ncbi:hypothetical protein IX51_01220 [uncultured archaeon]|nr:hypothetical protein IX51_01220 [uncultured archaeon]
MFIPVTRRILRWGTPDPEGDWIMYGHLILDESKCIAIDPPLVPGLIDSISRLGKLEAIMLTTLDHTRGARYISKKTGARLLIPDQHESISVNPEAILEQKEIREFERYGMDKIYGLKPFRITVASERTSGVPCIDEYAFLTPEEELIVGDIAIGDSAGNLVVAPEWFPHDPPHKPYGKARTEFARVVRESGADVLLSGHGQNIYGGLKEKI